MQVCLVQKLKGGGMACNADCNWLSAWYLGLVARELWLDMHPQ